MEPHRLPIATVLKKFKDPKVDKSVLKSLWKKFAIFSLLTKDIESKREIVFDVPSLNGAVEMLGQNQARLMVLNSISDLIGQVCGGGTAGGSLFWKWPEELYNLRENIIKSVALCEELVWAISYNILKKQDEQVLTIPGVCNIEQSSQV
jgi:hypothetical protein